MPGRQDGLPSPGRQDGLGSPGGQDGLRSLRALVVDDDKNTLDALAELVADEGFDVHKAATLREARRRLHAEPVDVVLVDLILPDGSGFDLIQELQEGQRSTDAVDVVVITGHASVETAVEALRRGAADYLTKPVSVPRIKIVLANLKRTHDLRHRVRELSGKLRELGHFGPLVGASAAMQAVYDLVTRVAPSSASALITGESGTGKELVAETVHKLSRRSAKPYLVVNCGALSPALIESELFGHERGSFTGADRAHHGYFERADGGTLLLDEVSEMPPELQVKLLRVLEAGAVMRVGGSKPVKVDVRIVAATNRDLDVAVAKGKFRQDLLYRLKVFPIPLPPLRERGDDVERLAEHFLAELNQQENAHKTLSRAAVSALRRHNWPGNVRELKNVIHRAFLMADTAIGPAELSPDLSRLTPGLDEEWLSIPPEMSLADVERRQILAALEHFAGDRRKAAAALGVSLRTLYNRLTQYQSAGAKPNGAAPR
jgi:DNA-binding NtrC family response regulator